MPFRHILSELAHAFKATLKMAYLVSGLAELGIPPDGPLSTMALYYKEIFVAYALISIASEIISFFRKK